MALSLRGLRSAFCGRFGLRTRACTFVRANTAPPTYYLGNLRFGPDLDVWSVGCVAAELFLRVPLFLPSRKDNQERSIVNGHFEFLGTPPKDTMAYAWMTSLPFFWKFYGIDSRVLATNPPKWPPAMLRDCQAHLADFVQQTLKLNPRERPSAASASQHEFVSSRALTVAVSVAEGKEMG